MVADWKGSKGLDVAGAAVVGVVATAAPEELETTLEDELSTAVSDPVRCFLVGREHDSARLLGDDVGSAPVSFSSAETAPALRD